MSLPPSGMASRAFTAKLRMAFSSWLASTLARHKPPARTVSIAMCSPSVRRSRSDMPATSLLTSVGLGSSGCWREKAMGERGRAGRARHGVLDAAADTRVGLGQAPLQHFEIADHHGEQVVEVVGDPAGQLADRFHFLRLTQLVLDPLPVRSGGLEALVGGREVARAPGDALLQGRVQ